jgi:cytochrome oxidase Cu insertion factor (SCO1/SenC/PrrC family)
MRGLSASAYKRTFVVLLIVLVLGFTFAPGCSPSGTSDIKVGNTAPDFTLYDLDGNQVSLSDFRGEAVFINFWASW